VAAPGTGPGRDEPGQALLGQHRPGRVAITC
jgi:hypothetical protein